MKTHVTKVLVLVLAITGVLSDPGPKIYNGDDAEPGEFPFMTGIRFQEGDHGFSTDRFFCGASLIRKNIVLTAAHCIQDLITTGVVAKTSEIEAVLGEHEQDADSGSEVVVRFKKIIPHPNYSSTTLVNDIALMILDDESVAKVVANPAIQPIKIAPTADLAQQLENGAAITLSGWGGTEDGNLSNILQKLVYTVVSEERCKQYWGSAIVASNLCTGNVEEGTLTAHSWSGDSGGPLFSKIGDEFYQLALVSYGVSTPSVDTYDVNTNVPYYYDWIQKKIEPMEEDEEKEQDEDDANDGGDENTDDLTEPKIWFAGSGGDEDHGVVFFYHPELGEAKAYAICNDGFGPTEATTICRHLGFQFGELRSYWEYAGHKNKDHNSDFGLTDVSCGEDATDFWNDCDGTPYQDSEIPCFGGEQVALQCANEQFSFTVDRLEVKQKYMKKKEILKSRYKCYPSIQKNGIDQPLGGVVEAAILSVSLDGAVSPVDVEMDMKGKKHNYFKGQSKQPMSEEEYAAADQSSCAVCVAHLDLKVSTVAYAFEEDCEFEDQLTAILMAWVEEQQNSDGSDNDTEPDDAPSR